VLAKLEQLGKLKAIITQNIDNLHQLAGSKEVIELHGNAYVGYTINTRTKVAMKGIVKQAGLPYYNGELVKPDVVLYEEGLDQEVVIKAIEYIKNADLLIIGGTSLRVYPANQFIKYYSGNKMIGINKEVIDVDYLIMDDLSKVFSVIDEYLIK
jgi:NAD-dependent deacetylase